MYSSCLSGLSFILGRLTQSKSVLSLAASLIPGVVYFADTDKPIIALTIDDGPDSTTLQKSSKFFRNTEFKRLFL